MFENADLEVCYGRNVNSVDDKIQLLENSKTEQRKRIVREESAKNSLIESLSALKNELNCGIHSKLNQLRNKMEDFPIFKKLEEKEEINRMVSEILNCLRMLQILANSSLKSLTCISESAAPNDITGDMDFDYFQMEEFIKGVNMSRLRIYYQHRRLISRIEIIDRRVGSWKDKISFIEEKFTHIKYESFYGLRYQKDMDVQQKDDASTQDACQECKSFLNFNEKFQLPNCKIDIIINYLIEQDLR